MSEAVCTAVLAREKVFILLMLSTDALPPACRLRRSQDSHARVNGGMHGRRISFAEDRAAAPRVWLPGSRR